MQAYTSRTGTLTTIAALRQAGWRWLVVPGDGKRGQLYGMPFAIDNGAWRCFTAGTPWDEAAFVATVHQHGSRADWIALPDIVAAGAASLERSSAWLPRLRAICGAPLLLPVQDGMADADIVPFAQAGVGVFLGGSTEWKLANALRWGRFARAHGVYYHIARVNTARRIRLCAAAGADSIDGTSAVAFPKTLALIERARGQRDLFAGH